MRSVPTLVGVALTQLNGDDLPQGYVGGFGIAWKGCLRVGCVRKKERRKGDAWPKVRAGDFRRGALRLGALAGGWVAAGLGCVEGVLWR